MPWLRPLALAALLAAPLPTSAGDLTPPLGGEANRLRIADAYIISAGPNAPTAAAYMRIANASSAPDRLVAVESDAARRIELHAHVLKDGVARMVRLADGVELPAGETVTLQRGGLHVMMMGLTNPLEDGAQVNLTLVFETAGRMKTTVPVDRKRADPAGESEP